MRPLCFLLSRPEELWSLRRQRWVVYVRVKSVKLPQESVRDRQKIGLLSYVDPGGKLLPRTPKNISGLEFNEFELKSSFQQNSTEP